MCTDTWRHVREAVMRPQWLVLAPTIDRCDHRVTHEPRVSAKPQHLRLAAVSSSTPPARRAISSSILTVLYSDCSGPSLKPIPRSRCSIYEALSSSLGSIISSSSQQQQLFISRPLSLQFLLSFPIFLDWFHYSAYYIPSFAIINQLD